MGANGKLIFGCIESLNIQCANGEIARPIFAPFSRQATPYDTLAYMFTGKFQSISAEKFSIISQNLN